MAAVEEMSCVWMLQRGHSGDGCVLVSTLCKYDLRKGGLFVLSWARVRRGSLSSELLMCGGGVRSILLLSLYVDLTLTLDPGMSLNCALTRVCPKSASRPGYMS